MAIEFQTSAWDERLANLKLPRAGDPISEAACRDLALTIARRGIGNVSPNPLVGAVIVDSKHMFVAAGAHEHVGQAHGEIMAIEAAKSAGLGEKIKGGTLYVTLEPCSHVGRTPACAPAVAAAGFANVVFGMVDPNPKVNGQGADLLRQKGVNVRHDVAWERECEALAEAFVWNMRKKQPFVGLKAATGLDGVMARHGDQRVFITGPRARAYGHYLRLVYDGIVVGANTMQLDNPDLTPRDGLIKGRTPWRVVVDPQAEALKKVGVEAVKILKAEPRKVAWITAKSVVEKERELFAQYERSGGQLISLSLEADGNFSPEKILSALHKLGLQSILLEGGAGLYAGFLNARLVNRLHLFQTPKLFGGEAIRFTEPAKQLPLAELSHMQMTQLGDDWVLEGQFS